MNRKLRTPLTLAALGLLGLLGAGHALAADGEDLHGRWRGIALERGGERMPIPPEVGIMVEFKAGVSSSAPSSRRRRPSARRAPGR